MSVSLNIEVNSANIFRLFYVNLMNFASILINTSANYNTKVSLTEFFRLFCISNFSFNDNVNLFCNIDNNFVFNVEIFL